MRFGCACILYKHVCHVALLARLSLCTCACTHVHEFVLACKCVKVVLLLEFIHFLNVLLKSPSRMLLSS